MTTSDEPIPAAALASLSNGAPPDDWEQRQLTPESHGVEVARIAQRVLDVVRAGFGSAGVELPERQVVVAGMSRGVAWDAEQLTVALVGIGWGASPGDTDPAGGGAGGYPSVGTAVAGATVLRHAVFEVQLVRRTVVPESAPGPSYRPPHPDDLHQKGLEFMQDADLLSLSILAACHEVDALAGSPGARTQAGTIEPLGPEGSMYGLATPLTCTLGGAR